MSLHSRASFAVLAAALLCGCGKESSAVIPPLAAKPAVASETRVDQPTATPVAPKKPVADAGVAAPPENPREPLPIDPTIAEAESLCDSGWEAVRTNDAQEAKRKLRAGIATLEPLGLALAPERGGDLLASCLHGLGRALEVAGDDATEEEAGPEALYARSLALRPSAEVRERLAKLLADVPEGSCRIGEVVRTVGRVEPYATSAAMIEALVADAARRAGVAPSGSRLGGADPPVEQGRDRCPAEVGAWMISAAPVHAFGSGARYSPTDSFGSSHGSGCTVSARSREPNG